MSEPSLCYIFNGRFPSEKAHALYVYKTCEAFYKKTDVRILVPNRKNQFAKSQVDFFTGSVELDCKYLFCIDLYNSILPTKIAFLICYLTFSISVFFYVLKLRSRERYIFFSNEYIPLFFISFLTNRIVYDMHDYYGRLEMLLHKLGKRIACIVTQNSLKKDLLVEELELDNDCILVEPNGVDVQRFRVGESAQKCRSMVGIDVMYEKVVVYTGHLFSWKGVEVLAEVAKILPEVAFYFVGGSLDDVGTFSTRHQQQKNIFVVGHRPHQEMPIWQASADCLVLPNSGKMRISEVYTSPMKLFEYLASEKPVVASDLPSIRAIVSDQEVTFFESDNSSGLADAIEAVLSMPKDKQAKQVLAAKQLVAHHTWQKRADRLLAFFHKTFHV